ncbi:MAG TPA: helix-turn-helix transcriptional regulator [Bacilli bacterium]|nr:helix-turn-helix transcriptional regulator [Bacilli bacterium]
MNEIGQMLASAREKNSVSIEEASEDLSIKVIILENIENGNIGSFKDIFILKEYIRKYAKYLGLDPEKVIDVFNEYLFEYTSKIPLKAIEKAVQEKNSEAKEDDKVKSPYTNIKSKHQSLKFILIYIIIGLIVAIAIYWSIRQITIGNNIATIAGIN